MKTIERELNISNLNKAVSIRSTDKNDTIKILKETALKILKEINEKKRKKIKESLNRFE